MNKKTSEWHKGGKRKSACLYHAIGYEGRQMVISYTYNMFYMYSYVNKFVEYCVSAWSPHYKKDKELLDKVLRRFTKTIKVYER